MRVDEVHGCDARVLGVAVEEVVGPGALLPVPQTHALAVRHRQARLVRVELDHSRQTLILVYEDLVI